jgi:branched-chain amino acid aminotransferase
LHQRRSLQSVVLLYREKRHYTEACRLIETPVVPEEDANVTSTGSQQYAFFQGSIVPYEEAKVGVLTHGLNYGTGVFEGIRAYWNPDQEDLFLFLVREHYVRFLKNTRMVFIDVPYSLDELVDYTVRLCRMQGLREDVYIRPLAYKSSEHIGVSMEGVADDTAIVVTPFGNYVDMDRGLSVCVSSWKRSDDNAIPGRAKITGNYVNSALAKNEAILNGFDEAIVLNQLGYVSEASAANIFLVRDGVLVTPSVADGILEGYTRDAIMKLAQSELGVSTIERSIGRSELYYADEMFLCGTGVQVAPVTSVDRRRVGTGEVGPISSALQEIYFDVVRARNPKYADWLTPVNMPARLREVSAH